MKIKDIQILDKRSNNLYFYSKYGMPHRDNDDSYYIKDDFKVKRKFGVLHSLKKSSYSHFNILALYKTGYNHSEDLYKQNLLNLMKLKIVDPIDCAVYIQNITKTNYLPEYIYAHVFPKYDINTDDKFELIVNNTSNFLYYVSKPTLSYYYQVIDHIKEKQIVVLQRQTNVLEKMG